MNRISSVRGCSPLFTYLSRLIWRLPPTFKTLSIMHSSRLILKLVNTHLVKPFRRRVRTRSPFGNSANRTISISYYQSKFVWCVFSGDHFFVYVLMLDNTKFLRALTRFPWLPIRATWMAHSAWIFIRLNVFSWANFFKTYTARTTELRRKCCCFPRIVIRLWVVFAFREFSHVRKLHKGCNTCAECDVTPLF